MNEARLHHLRRQQTLLREHLDWIESEIAREAGGESASSSPPPAMTVPAVASPTSEKNTEEADILLEQYAGEERQNPADIRRGCLLVFFAALALLIGGLVLLWAVRYR
jgi:hypothetical protein